MADDIVETRTWRRRDAAPPTEPAAPAGRITVQAPKGDAPPADVLAARIRASLAGWPVVVLRATGTVNGKARPGQWRGLWLRSQIGEIIDRTLSREAGLALLGVHTPGRVYGGAWAPIALRTSPLGEDRLKPDSDVCIEIVLHGRAAHAAGELVRALLNPAGGAAKADGFVRWRTVQHLVCDEGEEPRWRPCAPKVPAALLAVDRLTEPKIRARRVMVTFQSPTVIARRGEDGEPWPDFMLLVDRMGRTLSTLLDRSGHTGPRMPDDDLLRAAASARLVANHTRLVQTPSTIAGAEPPRLDRRSPTPPPEEQLPLLVGSATFSGDFEGLRPLLRAVSWLGMGPGRQNGLGEISIR